MKIGLILLSGGLSTRMGKGFSKVFYQHRNKPIARYSFDIFQQIELIKNIVVVCPPEKNHLFGNTPLFALPGKERFLSVESGLRALPKDIEFALVHDAARPLIVEDDVKKLIEIGTQGDGASLGARVKNTLMQASDQANVEVIIDRDCLWETYTPQIGRVSNLLKAISYCKKHEEIPGDEMTLLNHIGLSPKLVPSSFPNVKITYPSDLPLVLALLDQLQTAAV